MGKEPRATLDMADRTKFSVEYESCLLRANFLTSFTSPKSCQVVGVDGKPLIKKAYFSFKLLVGGNLFSHQFQGIPDCSSPLLEWDILQKV